MTNKVVSLDGKTVAGNEPVIATVELLRGLLAGAEAGDVRSIAMAWTDGNHKVITSWHNNGEYFFLIGGVAWLQQRMLDSTNTD